MDAPYKHAVYDPEGNTLSFALICNPISSCKRRMLPSLPYTTIDPLDFFSLHEQTGQLRLKEISIGKGEGKFVLHSFNTLLCQTELI